MTLAEKLRKEGYDKGVQHGLIEGIEALVSLKFTHDAARIMPLIYQIKEISLLKVVKSSVLTAKSADELIDIIKNFDAAPAPRCGPW